MSVLCLFSSSFSWGYLITSPLGPWSKGCCLPITSLFFYSQVADLADLTSQLLSIHHLHEDVVSDALQKSPGLLALHYVTLPANVEVTEVLHDNLVLQPWDFFMCFEAFHQLFDQEVNIQGWPRHSPCLSLLKISLKSSWSACRMLHSKVPCISLTSWHKAQHSFVFFPASFSKMNPSQHATHSATIWLNILEDL